MTWRGRSELSVPRGVEVGGLSEHVADSASQASRAAFLVGPEPGLVSEKAGYGQARAAVIAACGKWWGRGLQPV